MKIVSWLLLLFGALWLVDTAATVQFVSVLGTEAEGNPIMRELIAQFGIGGFIAVKATIGSFWLYIGNKAHWSIHVVINLIMTVVAGLALLVAMSTF